MEKIKVILSHPQVIFREGIHFILSGEEDFDVAGEATGNRQALELIEAGPPDVAVLSDGDDKFSIAEVTRRVKMNFPGVAVVLITEKTGGVQLFPAIVSGISASLTPDTDPEHMVTVIRDVAHGRLPVVDDLLKPELASRTLADFQDLATLNEHLGIHMAPLSKKETEILSGIVTGGGKGDVETRLGLSGEALRTQLRIIIQKLVANDRNRAVIAEAQRDLPSLMPGGLKGRGETQEYLTRTEFNDFKNSLMARFKSFVSEKP